MASYQAIVRWNTGFRRFNVFNCHGPNEAYESVQNLIAAEGFAHARIVSLHRNFKAKEGLKMADSLPEFCYFLSPIDKQWIMLKRGQAGYFPTDYGEATQEAVDALNAKMGVTKAQSQAMYAGSLFGWGVPGADPANYHEDGTPLTMKERREKKAVLNPAVVEEVINLDCMVTNCKRPPLANGFCELHQHGGRNEEKAL